MDILMANSFMSEQPNQADTEQGGQRKNKMLHDVMTVALSGDGARMKGALEKVSPKKLLLLKELVEHQEQVNIFNEKKAAEMAEKREANVEQIKKLMEEAGLKLDGSLLIEGTNKTVPLRSRSKKTAPVQATA